MDVCILWGNFIEKIYKLEVYKINENLQLCMKLIVQITDSFKRCTRKARNKSCLFETHGIKLLQFF